MAGVISDCTKSSVNVQSILYIAMFIQHIVVQFAITLSVNRQIKSTLAIVEQKLAEISQMTNNFSLIVYLKSEMSTTVDYTAGDLFNLRNEFIMSFIGGLISFTVMFLQMSTPGVTN